MFRYRHPDPLPWARLVGPIAAAEAALARLDERLATSPVAAGWRERSHFAAVCAEAALAGDLVHLEDLVLHDAGMDVRTPTAELVRAHAALRRRRRLAECLPSSAWNLVEREAFGSDQDPEMPDGPAPDDGSELATAMAAVEMAVGRVTGVLADGRSSLLYAPNWEEGRRDAWDEVVTFVRDLPATLAAVMLADAWRELIPVGHREDLSWTMAAALLRERGTRHHLPALAIGIRTVPRLRWQAHDPSTRLLALLEALSEACAKGLADHDRWMRARGRLLGKVAGRRANSRLPALVDLVMSRPLLSAGMIAKELRITPQAAQNFVVELNLREMTGRGRYRAWGIL